MGKETVTVAELLDTFYDTPTRTDQSEIDQIQTALHSEAVIGQILEGFSDPAALLDQNRQMVMLNSLAVDLFKSVGTIDAIGRRIGEAVRCIHSDEMPAGCGTSQACASCGVAGAICRTTNEKVRDHQNARVTIHLDGKDKSLDLRATTAVLNWDGRIFTLVSLKDTSDENRRHVLERIFFHDVLNTAGAVSGIATLLPDTTDTSELSELYSMLNSSGEQLIQEIQTQRDLARAEQGELKASPSNVNASQILDKVRGLYGQSPFAEGKEILFQVKGADFTIESDQTMLVRCVGNLVKNALEASAAGQKVIIAAECGGSLAIIKVKNECVMPESVRLQVFQRSFSTKAAHGRGLGTYSVKLLVEQYLNGKVSVESTTGTGTVFTIVVPRMFAGRLS
jgi:K+-sensing histidine kinase KdpD